MTYGEYLQYVYEAKNYDSAEKIQLEYGFPAECEFTGDGLVKAIDIIFAVSRSDFPKLVRLSSTNPSAMCRRLNIPARTAQHWVSGDRNPPEYIIQLIGFALISECDKEGEYHF